MNEEQREALTAIFDKLKVDVNELFGRECDVLLTVHPEHEDGQCAGLALNCHAEPEQAHKMAYYAIMWAEQYLAHHHRMMEPATDASQIN